MLVLSCLVLCFCFFPLFAVVIVFALFLFIFLLLVCSIILFDCPFFMFSFLKQSLCFLSFVLVSCCFLYILLHFLCFVSCVDLLTQMEKQEFCLVLSGLFKGFFIRNVGHQSPERTMATQTLSTLQSQGPNGKPSKKGKKNLAPRNGLTQHVLSKPLVNRSTCNATRRLGGYVDR